MAQAYPGTMEEIRQQHILRTSIRDTEQHSVLSPKSTRGCGDYNPGVKSDTRNGSWIFKRVQEKNIAWHETDMKSKPSAIKFYWTTVSSCAHTLVMTETHMDCKA